MRVTTKGRYALRAMVNLALNGNGKPLSIKKITEIEKLSPIFLEQIFTKLKKFELIQSIRGAGGGFILTRDAADITVRDILEAVEEGIRLTPCCADDATEASQCEYTPACRVTKFWKEANDHVMDYFGGLTLQGIIDKYELVPDVIPAKAGVTT